MSREYPDWISPERAADGKRIFSGTIPLSRMQRLVPLIVSADGDVSFTAAFSYDIDRRVIIDLEVEAALPLVCQASLEVYDEQVKRQCVLAVIEQDYEQEEIADNYDVVKTENGRLAMAALVEDELLLGLPHVPRKQGMQKVDYSTDGASLKSAGTQDEGKTNPFAALQDMLERKKQD